MKILLSKIIFILLPLCIGTSVYAAENSVLLDILVQSYPDQNLKHDNQFLLWPDGTRMLFDDGRNNKNFENLLNEPSLKDMFYAPYMSGGVPKHPAKNKDPGRVRYEPFFTKMYGDCRHSRDQPKLVDLVWLPKKWGKQIQITDVNGVAKRLEKISDELDSLPRSYDKYLYPIGGTYNCRQIAGTKRLSAHGSGTAIDISIRHSDYWRWNKPDQSGLYVWKNRIPIEIVKIFEKHGFIWGGKWYHFDSMHFEYRPEILEASKYISGMRQKN